MYIYYYSLLNLKQWMRQPEWEETRTQASCYNTGGGGGSLQPANFKGHWVGAGGVIVQGVKCEYLFLSLSSIFSTVHHVDYLQVRCQFATCETKSKRKKLFLFSSIYYISIQLIPPLFCSHFPSLPNKNDNFVLLSSSSGLFCLHNQPQNHVSSSGFSTLSSTFFFLLLFWQADYFVTLSFSLSGFALCSYFLSLI